MLRAVIVDDEPKAIDGLLWELKQFDSDINVVQTFTDPEMAIPFLNNSSSEIDCLFLDIQMPKIDGFSVLSRLHNKGEISTIITTAYDDYAIKAIKNEAIDYLLKPIDSDDLKETIAKLKKANKNITNLDKVESLLHKYYADSNKKKITINTDGKLIFLDQEEIIFVESEGNYCTIHTSDNQKIVVTKKIKEINNLLPEKVFFRIHNSYIINLNKVKEFIKTEGYVLMSNEHQIPVARQRKLDFLDNY